ncbi:TPA: glycosyl transferase [Candidatus Sumerlaeota bacterium]|jgi:dolichol-phosphate mannosyltransferase|nr:glycosyl transferase [Candidatus Sumerlaeota bacterium]
MKLTVIMPIFNEEEFLEKVLERVRQLPDPKEIILVDDCSTDSTRDILKHQESIPGTIVLYHEKNRGKGFAIRTGLTRATGDVVIVQDADLEYDPMEIPGVIQPIVDGKSHVAFGSRFMGKIEGMRFPNRVANRLMALTASLLYGSQITDEATCYKAFSTDLICRMPLRCERFEFCPEVTAMALRLGEKIIETPITYRARTFEEGKKIGWRDFVTAMRYLIAYRFRPVRLLDKPVNQTQATENVRS